MLLKVIKSNCIEITLFSSRSSCSIGVFVVYKNSRCVIITIFSDSQSVLKSLTSFNTNPLITYIQNIYSILFATHSIDLHWCPGHVNIYGNECSDRLAKVAVEYRRQPSIPYKLPLGHAKLKLKRHTLDLWQKSWENSTNGRLTHDFIPNLRRNSIAHINLHYKLTAVITGHGTFNMYRQFYGHTLSAYCDCKTALDDVKHYLFNCLLYASERKELIDSIISMTFFPPNLNELLSNPLIFYHLNNFITNTEKTNFYYHSPFSCHK